MIKAMQGGLRQYELVESEETLLKETLSGSVDLLIELLAIAAPVRCGRAEKSRDYVRLFLASEKSGDEGELGVAAMLSRIGAVTMPYTVLENNFLGKELSPVEQSMYGRFPQIGHDLLANIPRLKDVANIILYHQWVRRQYPDNHKLFLESVADQVRMLRNHPSLAFYCGGNELPPPEDILSEMQNSLLPALDSTRYFFTYSNTDSMSYNFIGGNGDGPYHIEPTDYFWEHRSFSFNSEVGSVGMGDYQSLERFIPPKDLVIPDSTWAGLDSVWRYHKYIGYGNRIDAYGKPATLRQFAKTAQLVNYDQYRALMEGHLSHMWSWYTGVIIWKTQNPWTALRGQMYDYYLDPNGGLYGLRHAGESLHVMYNPVNKIVEVVNQTFQRYHDLMLEVRSITPAGKDSLITSWIIQVRPTSVQKYVQLERIIPKLYSSEGGFLDLRLLNMSHKLMSENLYWLPDSTGQYTGIEHMPAADITAQAAQIDSNRIAVNIKDPSGGPLAFFNRISLVDSLTGKRILPVFYSDNYVSVLPGEQLTVYISCTAGEDIADAVVSISGWNVKKEYLHIR